jgi:hypothetical protein
MFKPEVERLESREVLTNPTNPQQIYVDSVYQQVLGRRADSAGLTYWVGRMNQGASRDEVALEIQHSQEGQNNVIFDLYQQLLGRTPDATGYAYWGTLYSQGATIDQLRAGIASSSEYFAIRGGSTNAGYVKALLSDFLNREPDTNTTNVFLNAQAAGATTYDVAFTIATSNEAHKQLVLDEFSRYLNQSPSAAQLNYFANLLSQVREENIIATMIASPAHQALE